MMYGRMTRSSAPRLTRVGMMMKRKKYCAARVCTKSAMASVTVGSLRSASQSSSRFLSLPSNPPSDISAAFFINSVFFWSSAALRASPRSSFADCDMMDPNMSALNLFLLAAVAAAAAAASLGLSLGLLDLLVKLVMPATPPMLMPNNSMPIVLLGSPPWPRPLSSPSSSSLSHGLPHDSHVSEFVQSLSASSGSPDDVDGLPDDAERRSASARSPRIRTLVSLRDCSLLKNPPPPRGTCAVNSCPLRWSRALRRTPRVGAAAQDGATPAAKTPDIFASGRVRCVRCV
mmetsp:Transcript_34988/g.85748  ORF Transcript_34988/g.85748 Transcript_34988/m.85748 type:complete len:288 (-) Transcript_34988:16-879(-)